MTSPSPRLSIVVYARDVPAALPDCLAALAALDRRDETELILADATADGGLRAAGRAFPAAAHVARPRASMPTLRAEAVGAARGELVAFLGATAVAGSDWAAVALAAFGESPGAAAAGGPVRWGGGAGAAARGAYLFEYGAFHPPVADGPTDGDLPGINVVYRRRLLTGLCGDLLAAHGFYKPLVHARLRRAGHTLELRSRLAVELRDEHRFAAFVRRRFHYGRCFGDRRLGAESAGGRRRLRLLAPLVPALLVARHLARAARHPAERRWLPASALPLAVVCLAWGLGEWRGIWRGAGPSCEEIG